MHRFSLYYIDYVSHVSGPRTNVTFSFGEYLTNIIVKFSKFLLCRYEGISDSVWTILPLSGQWGKSPLLVHD